MNRIFKKGIPFLALGFIFIVFSLILYNIENIPSNYKINPKSIAQKIAKEESLLKKSLLSFKEKLIENESEFTKETNSYYFEKLDPVLNTNFVVLVFRNDTLKFWSDNTIPNPAGLIDTSYTNKKILKLDNGWYYKISEKINTHTIIGFIRLKNSYYFDNQYLQSNFTFDEDIPSSYLISDKPISIGENIVSNQGEYLFSLIPSGMLYKDECSDLPAVLFILGLILIFIAISKYIQGFSSYKLSLFFSSLLILICLAIVYSIYKFEIPNYIFYSHLFNNHTLIEKPDIPSPGLLLLFSLSVFFIIVNIFKILPIESLTEKIASKHKLLKALLFTFFFTAITLFWLWINLIIEKQVLNVDFTFNITNILKIQTRDIVMHIAISALFASFIVLLDLFLKLCSRISSIKEIPIPVFLSILICLFLFPNHQVHPTLIKIIFLILFIAIISGIRLNKNEYNYVSIIFIVLILSIFAVISENGYELEKRKEIMSKGIERLSSEKDIMAERFLKEIDLRLSSDTGLTSILINVNPKQDLQVFDYLKRKYFYGFWEKYDLEIVICGNSEFYRIENQALNCEGYYNELFDSSGIKVDNSSFWFIQNNTGKITYTGIVKVDHRVDERDLQLYITLSEKLTSKFQGYPELLIDKSSGIKNELENYSYAKYSNSLLAVKSGDYSYEMTDIRFTINNSDESFVETKYYLHAVKKNSEGRTIVLSQRKKNFFDHIISTAYLFVIYNLLLLISILLINSNYILSRFKFDFKNQIRYSMIGILALSFLLFGSGTIYYTVKQNRRTNKREMLEKVQSVLIELKQKLQDEKELTPDWRSETYDHLDELLIKFSEVFFSDINLYNINGNLLATSRSEIFNRGLIGNQMNSLAFKSMAIKKNTEFIQEENIGSLEFSSVYVPLQNVDNKTISYVNIPYFTENTTLQKNISDVLITVINFYVILFLLSVFLALIISNQITRPLRMLQNKIKSVQFGKKQQEIIYNKKDEIGELVKEYNLMIKKIELSAEKLAESERESAWREMAKQIAHEIKNPLTPMKLSIQLLQKTWFDKSGNKQEFENRLNTVAETLIEQINTLSSIASEFSAFAKMPKARNEEVEIAKKLRSVVGLFENTKNIEIILNINNNENLKIIADKEQVSRVFINLIKNAIQAIPHKQKGIIEITLEKLTQKARITVMDNGEGIPNDKKERLFEPSFTTKTTGMGIGLAIVKNIVESAGGNISFDSESGSGTSFFVEFLIP